MNDTFLVMLIHHLFNEASDHIDKASLFLDDGKITEAACSKTAAIILGSIANAIKEARKTP